MTVVAWIDLGDRIGVCPRCVPGAISKRPELFDVVPVGVGEAKGKGCAECGEPLVGDPYLGSRVLMQEYVLEADHA